MGVPVAVGFLLISEHYRMDENEGRAAESAAVDLGIHAWWPEYLRRKKGSGKQRKARNDD